jgi:hypothetical protein
VSKTIYLIEVAKIDLEAYHGPEVIKAFAQEVDAEECVKELQADADADRAMGKWPDQIRDRELRYYVTPIELIDGEGGAA